MAQASTDLARGVVTVGAGRGFVMDVSAADPGIGRIVVTAAHCLPHLPPAHGFSHTEERTYAKLLGPLGESPSIWSECLFAGPVADLAVLVSPDNQALFEEADAFEQFIEATRPLPLGTLPEVPAWELRDRPPIPGQVLSLDGQWISCGVHCGRRLFLSADVPIEGGMSGSPIIVEGAAAGVIALSELSGRADMCVQARLSHDLPAWIVRTLEGETLGE